MWQTTDRQTDRRRYGEMCSYRRNRLRHKKRFRLTSAGTRQMVLPPGEWDRQTQYDSIIRNRNRIAKNIWAICPWSTLSKISSNSVHKLLEQIQCKLSPHAQFATNREESWIVIRNPLKNPDRHQNQNSCSLGHDQILQKISPISAHYFLSYTADKQTDNQTDRQTDRQTNGQTLSQSPSSMQVNLKNSAQNTQ